MKHMVSSGGIFRTDMAYVFMMSGFDPHVCLVHVEWRHHLALVIATSHLLLWTHGINPRTRGPVHYI